MSTLFDAARDFQTLLESCGWRFCFIGGLAVLRWGEPRFTRDVAVTLDSGHLGRISDAREFACRNQALLLQSPDGVPIDIALVLDAETIVIASAPPWTGRISRRTYSR